jgi:hypothetical protein
MAAIAVATAAPSFGADLSERKDMSGRYFCYVTGSAGILQEQGKPNYYGAITLPDTMQKFTISVNKIEREPLNVDLCRKSVGIYLDALASGQSYRDFDQSRDPKMLQRREWIGWDCLTKDELVLEEPYTNGTYRYRSYDLQFQFYGLSPDHWIELFSGGAFRRSASFDSGTIVIQEGQCEKIEAPK